MKRKSIITVLATLIFVLCAVFGVACGGNKSLTLSETSLSLNLYDEVTLTVAEEGNVSWTSSDETIVKVNENGLVMAQGEKGDATVTATIGKAKATCSVKVRNKSISPVLDAPEARGFVNAWTTPDVYINYKNVRYTPDEVSFTSNDENVVIAENGKIKGVSEGTATLSVSAVWKKRTVTGETTVTVYPERSLLLAETEINLFNVPDDTQAKKNTYEVLAEVFDKGVALENPSIVLTPIGENAECLTVDGNLLKVDGDVASALTTQGKVVVDVKVSSTVDGNEVSSVLKVNVCPNYISMDPLKELTDTKLAKVKPVLYDGEVAGRTGVVDYSIPNVYDNAHASASKTAGSWLNNVWANWNTRLEFASTMTLNGISAYEFIQSEGYKLISFDVYYQGHYSENGELIQSGMFFGMNGCSSYFYVDCQNNREDILIVNQAGEITNTLKLNEWQTVFLDLDALITASTIAGKNDCNSFLSMNQVGDVCYIDDIRYWYDTTVLESYENKLDMDERVLTQDGVNQAKANAPENEFVAFSTVYVSFAESELNGVSCYKYDSTKPENFKAFDTGRRNKLNAYNDLKGIAVKKDYRYITFDIFVESGEPKIVYYDLFEQKELTLNLTNGATARSRGIKFFTQTGAKKEVESFATGTWMTVSVRIDGKAKENFYITTDKASVFYMKNVNYYKDDSFIYEHGADAQLRATLDGVEYYYYANDEINLREILDVRFAGVKISDYTLAVEGYHSVASYDESTGVLKATQVGESLVSVKAEKDGHSWDVQFTLRVAKDSRVELKESTVELYGGKGKYGFDTDYEISVKAYEDRKLISADRLYYEILSGGEYITLVGNKISAMEESVIGAPVSAKVRVWFENVDGTETSAELEITVFDTYRSRGEDELIWGNRSEYAITYEQVEEIIGGREGVAKYYSATAQSWYDRLTVYESAHPIKGDGVEVPYANHVVAFNNLTNKNIQYITFDIYLTAGSLLRVQAPDCKGVRDQRNDYEVGYSDANGKRDNENIWLFHNGKKMTGTVLADTWYTVVIDHKTAELGDNAWTAIFLTGRGTVYFDNIRYYQDLDWMYDFARDEIVTISGEVAQTQFIGESVAFQPTVSYMNEPVQNAEITVTSGNTQIATYDKQTGKLSFHAVGEVNITARVTVNGITQEKVWLVSVEKLLSLNTSEVTMVIGGKETVIATTGPADYTLTWQTADNGVATVENGVITAVAKGETTITAIFGENEESVTVKVVDYIAKDGSEIVYTTENPTKGNYSLATGTVGGRTGVYQYTTTAKEWTDKLNIKVGGHLNSADGPAKVKALREFKTKGYNFVRFDVYMTNGSSMSISALVDETTYAGDTLVPGSAITEKNANVKVYYLDKEVSQIVADTWYTVIVDLSQIDVDVYAEKASVYSRIELGGILGTVYFDEVRYYANDSWKTEINATNYLQGDGSEFVKARPFSDSTGSYGLYDGEVQGRTGVYQYTSTNSGWGDKIGVKQANHLSYVDTPVYANSTTAYKNMLAKNFAYVTFDICLVSGGIVINTPDSASTATSLQKYDKVYVNSTTKGTDKISYYTVDAQGKYTEVQTLSANTWYTVVVEYDTSLTMTSASYAGIDIASLSATTCVYLDNVRYYTANPVVI